MTDIKKEYNSADVLDDLNALMYIIKNQIENSVNTIDIVRVVKVNDNNTLDVLPIIKDINASKEPIDESVIYGISFLRTQSGKNAIKIDPVVGDIGFILTCKKDISAIASGMVGSRMKYNPANSIYIGGLFGLNQEPTQFLEFGEDTVKVKGTGTITIDAPTVEVKATTAKVEATGTATVKGATVNVEATTALNLGGVAATAGVARIGDAVNLQTGKIVGGSTLVKSL